MGNACSDMCVRDEEIRSTQPMQTIKKPIHSANAEGKTQAGFGYYPNDTNKAFNQTGGHQENINLPEKASKNQGDFLDHQDNSGFRGISNGQATGNTKIQKNSDGTFTYTLDDGSVYRGQMNDTKREGRGTQNYSDGSVYEGDWRDDQASGKGQHKYLNGNVYQGDWKNGSRNGYGTYTYSNGLKYTTLT